MQRVFVSSLIDAMRLERAAAREAIEAVGAEPVMFEFDLGGQDVDAQAAYLAGVRSSGIYVGLFGPVYGVPLPDGFSATEAEFNEAQERGLRLITLVQSVDRAEVEGRQQRFIAGLRNILTTAPYVTPNEITSTVTRRLREIAAEQLAPWVKLDDAVVRATSIRETGNQVVIVSRVLDPRIRARVERLRDQRSDFRVVFAGKVVTGFVSEVQALHTSTVSAELQITVTVRDNGANGNWMRGSFSTGTQRFTPDELTKLSLADSLYGTNTSPDVFGRPKVDLLEPLRGAHLPEAALRPLVELLITEYLVGNGAASIVDSVRLGPPHRGSRLLAVKWAPPHVYVNVPAPEPLVVEGTVSGF